MDTCIDFVEISEFSGIIEHVVGTLRDGKDDLQANKEDARESRVNIAVEGAMSLQLATSEMNNFLNLAGVTTGLAGGIRRGNTASEIMCQLAPVPPRPLPEKWQVRSAHRCIVQKMKALVDVSSHLTMSLTHLKSRWDSATKELERMRTLVQLGWRTIPAKRFEACLLNGTWTPTMAMEEGALRDRHSAFAHVLVYILCLPSTYSTAVTLSQIFPSRALVFPLFRGLSHQSLEPFLANLACSFQIQFSIRNSKGAIWSATGSVGKDSCFGKNPQQIEIGDDSITASDGSNTYISQEADRAGASKGSVSLLVLERALQYMSWKNVCDLWFNSYLIETEKLKQQLNGMLFSLQLPLSSEIDQKGIVSLAMQLDGEIDQDRKRIREELISDNSPPTLLTVLDAHYEELSITGEGQLVNLSLPNSQDQKAQKEVYNLYVKLSKSPTGETIPCSVQYIPSRIIDAKDPSDFNQVSYISNQLRIQLDKFLSSLGQFMRSGMPSHGTSVNFIAEALQAAAKALIL